MQKVNEKKSIDMKVTSTSFEKLIRYLENNTSIQIGFDLKFSEKQAI